jgi:hypothetical protein
MQELEQGLRDLEQEEDSPLELLETTVLPNEERPTELPKRRKYQRKNRDTVEDETRSLDTPGDPPKRRYVPRAKQPEKIVEREAEAYEAQLAALFLLVGGATSMLLPVTGTTMVVRASQGASAIVEAAKANPRIAAALIAMLKVGHYGPLVMFGMTMLTAVAVDIGALPPLSPPAQMMIKDVVDRFQVQTPVESNGYAAQASESSHE